MKSFQDIANESLEETKKRKEEDNFTFNTQASKFGKSKSKSKRKSRVKKT